MTYIARSVTPCVVIRVQYYWMEMIRSQRVWCLRPSEYFGTYADAAELWVAAGQDDRIAGHAGAAR